MSRKRNLLIGLFSMLLVACTTTNYYTYSLNDKYSQQWRGESQKTIIDTYGAPNRIVDAGNGNKIIVYEDYSVRAFSTTIGGFDVGKARKKRTFIEFYMNNSGQCYQVKTSDTGTYSKKEKVSFGEWLNNTFR